MSHFLHRFLVGLMAAAALAAAPVSAQAPGGQGYSQEELDQILAPIALYPDELLMQVLIAATYPLEVIDAARFVQQNPNLRGEQLDEALAGKSWDPSVQSLAAFPQVLEMMNEKLDWMQRLGDAFLVDQQRVMDTVQALRARAQAAGTLQSTPQQSVLTQGSEILIEPVQPDVIYVPAYNPYIVYGPWWAPDYPPWLWYPPAYYGYPVGVGLMAGIYFGTGWGISHHHWGWARPDWRGRHVNVHVSGNRFWNRPGHAPPGGTWRHEPDHRRGVAYPDLATHDRYRRVNPDAVRARQEFRGRERAQPTPNVARPGPGSARPGSDLARPSYDGQRPAPNLTPPRDAGRPAPGAGYPAPQGARPQPAPQQGTRTQPAPQGAGPQATPRAIGPSQAPQAMRPLPRPSVPGFDPGMTRQQTQANALRGQQSRQSPAPAAPPASHAPSAAPAPPASSAPSAAPATRGGDRKR